MTKKKQRAREFWADLKEGKRNFGLAATYMARYRIPNLVATYDRGQRLKKWGEPFLVLAGIVAATALATMLVMHGRHVESGSIWVVGESGLITTVFFAIVGAALVSYQVVSAAAVFEEVALHYIDLYGKPSEVEVTSLFTWRSLRHQVGAVQVAKKGSEKEERRARLKLGMMADSAVEIGVMTQRYVSSKQCHRDLFSGKDGWRPPFEIVEGSA